MKSITCITIVLGLLTFGTTRMNAQAPDRLGNVTVMTTMELAFPQDGSVAEFDSLTQLYTDRVVKKNEYIISRKFFNHWYGSNNRQLVILLEVKNWGDVEKAAERSDELFEKAWTTPEERRKYNRLQGKYFTGGHSDELYREIKSARK